MARRRPILKHRHGLAPERSGLDDAATRRWQRALNGGRNAAIFAGGVPVSSLSTGDDMARKTIGVVGAGNMGSGIAQKIATEGFDVVLMDVTAEAAQRGLDRIRTLLQEGVERRLFTPEQVGQILGRIRANGDLQASAACDIVIEAVFEDLDVKRDLFRKLDGICGADTILATNTSSFYVRDLATATRRADRVVGMHYFYHPAKNRLVEVVPCEATSAETTARAWRFNESIGKTPIHSADAPGFVVNRYFVPWINEAVRLHEEGIDIATLEAAAKEAFGIGMGPFELMNVTGIPIGLHAASTLGRELGAFYAPAAALAKQVERGTLWPLGGDPDRSRFDTVADRLLAVVYQVAGTLVDEGVASIEDVDIGARVGLRWRQGPFERMNRDGVGTARKRVAALCQRWPDLRVPRCLEQQAQKNEPFAFRLVKLHVQDGLAEITLNRPDAMNALNEEVVRQLAVAFDTANERADVRTIVLRGAGKAFVAGADIRYFVRHIEAKTIPQIVAFTERAQQLFKRIDESRKLVICRLDGLSLGGGSELALCADVILATEKGSLGFPETGIGIYPGLGGTQRTTRRVGVGLARYLVLTGDAVDATTALRMGLVDEIVPSERMDERIAEIHRTRKAPQARPDIDERLQALRAFFETADIEALCRGEAAAPEPVARVAARVKHKAPIACRLADAMIRSGVQDGIDAGLAQEGAHLAEIFATADAYEGLTSLGKKRPEFKGR
jgi:enoyl-CoA hydratase/3-hydroxyacyl-CoA dehydrogenase